MRERLPRDDVRTQRAGDALRRYWGRILCVTIALGTIAAAYAYLLPHKYRSTATVVVRPLTGNALSTQTNSGSQSVSVAMTTEAGLVSSVGVTHRVNRALGTQLKAGDPRVGADVPENSQVVKITYTAKTPRQAQQRAQAYARGFLEYRSNLAEQSRQAQLTKLNAQIASVERQLSEASAAAARKDAPADAASKIHLSTSALSSLQSELGSVQSISTDPGSVVAPAMRPHASGGLKPVFIVGAGLLAGLIISGGIAIWLGRLDDRVRASADLTVDGLPVLAVLPHDVDQTGGAAHGAARSHAHLEGVRRARTGFLGVAGPGSVVAVAGISGGEPSLATAMSLGQSLATSGYRVAVVDAVSDPSSAIGADRDGSGLADLILGGPVPDVLPLERVGRVQVLRSGSLSDAVRERLSGREMREVLDRLQAESDYVLVAVPHTGSWDGLAVLLAVDKVVLLVTERATTHEQVASAASAVGRVGVTVLGVLVQKAAHGRTSRGRSAIGPDAGRTRPHVARPGGELPDDADFEVDPENSRRVTVPSMPPR